MSTATTSITTTTEPRGELLSVAMGAVQEMVFLVAVEGKTRFRLVMGNRAFFDAVRLDAEEVEGHDLTDLAPATRAFLVKERCRQAVRVRRSIAYQEEATLPGGDAVIDTTLSPVLDEDGGITRLVGISRDVTSQWRADRRQSAHFAVVRALATAPTATEALPEILRALSQGLGCEAGLFWSMSGQEARCEHVWYDPALLDASLGHDLERRQASESGLAASVRGQGQTLVADLAQEAEVEDRTPWRRLRGACAFPLSLWGETIGVIELVSVRTWSDDRELVQTLELIGSQVGQFLARMQTEAELRESEARKAAILETALDVILGVDAQGRVFDFNPAAESAFGLAPAELQGRRFGTLVRWPELEDEAGVRMLGDLRVALRRTVETVAYRADGTEFPAEVAVVSVDREGAPAYTAFVRDITERKEVEELKDGLISTVSHELRTPLASLRGFTELMLNRDFSATKRREFLEIIQNESVRLNELIDDLLDVQRMEAGGELYSFESTDVLAVLRDAVALFDQDYGAVPIRLEADPELPRLVCDASRLRQVLINLLSNAVKFSPDGGEVLVGATVKDDALEVSVCDRGVGIPADVIPQLFDKFYRVNNPLTRDVGGTGLGLALVRRIVQAHGGTVDVDSEVGVGSCFMFRIPLRERG